MNALQPGSWVGSYRLIAPLRATSPLAAWAAEREDGDRRFRLEIGLGLGPEVEGRWLDRARGLVSARRDAGLVRVYTARRLPSEAGLGEGVMAVSELVPGPTLGELLRRGPLPAPAALELGARLCEGLLELRALGLGHGCLLPDHVAFDDAEQPRLGGTLYGALRADGGVDDARVAASWIAGWLEQAGQGGHDDTVPQSAFELKARRTVEALLAGETGLEALFRDLDVGARAEEGRARLRAHVGRASAGPDSGAHSVGLALPTTADAPTVELEPVDDTLSDFGVIMPTELPLLETVTEIDPSMQEAPVAARPQIEDLTPQDGGAQLGWAMPSRSQIDDAIGRVPTMELRAEPRLVLPRAPSSAPVEPWEGAVLIDDRSGPLHDDRSGPSLGGRSDGRSGPSLGDRSIAPLAGAFDPRPSVAPLRGATLHERDETPSLDLGFSYAPELRPGASRPAETPYLVAMALVLGAIAVGLFLVLAFR